MTWVIQGDCRQVLAGLPSESVDSIVTDPPYELGFMGKRWDSTGIAYDANVWRECLRVLKPGGHLLSFGGTRTYHRMACAIEDAGFEIRDSLHWIYGQGFPKSLDVSKAIDKAAGAERPVIGERKLTGTARIKGGQGNATSGRAAEAYANASELRDTLQITAPATEDAKRWSGWGTALKPAHEPIVMARKPLIGTVAANVLEHGVGGINVDGCRVEGGPPKGEWPITSRRHADVAWTVAPVSTDASTGRFPANVLADEETGLPEFFRYQAKASKRDRGEGNSHPTVKPRELMRWLVRLVTPPGGLVLDPFAGSGTTLLAARDEGMRALGVEMEAEHVAIINRRLAA